MQILMLTPSPGSKLFDPTYTSGQVFKSVGGTEVRPHVCDGNRVVASGHNGPWQKQLTMLAGYLYFYNPIWFVVGLARARTSVSRKYVLMQIIGMMGLVMTAARTSGWALRLAFGRIERETHPPVSQIPMRSIDGAPASHDPSVTSIQIPRPLVRHRAPPRGLLATDGRTFLGSLPACRSKYDHCT